MVGDTSRRKSCFRARQGTGRSNRTRAAARKEVFALLAMRASSTEVTAPDRAATRRRANAQRTVATYDDGGATTCGYLGPSRPVKLIDCSQVLVGEVFASGGKELKDRVQQRHRCSGAFFNLPYELQVLQGKPDGKASRVLMAPHLVQFLEGIRGAERSAVEQRDEL